MTRVLQVASVATLVVLLIVLAMLPAKACCGRYLAPALENERGLHLGEWHHGYAVLLGVIPWLPIQIPALILGLDDLLGQHLWHLSEKHAQHRSPLHRLYYRLRS